MNKPTVTNSDLLHSALAGLRGQPKTLEAKWFYDAQGSALFEQITELPEYYPTRTELSILRDHAARLAQELPAGSALVELGSGASTKTRILLDHLDGLAAYCPVDISADFLQDTAKRLAADYPALPVVPVVADFMAPLPMSAAILTLPKVVFFPGSTIGNLQEDEAIALLARLRALPEVTALILGADLVKDSAKLVAAYDDAAGVTAAFNRNLLTRLNRETGATFDVQAFAHDARWNDELARIEMHLVSQRAQTVDLAGQTISFAKGESIHTENSHKYTRARLQTMARQSGWGLDEMLTVPDHAFAVTVLKPVSSRAAQR